MKAIPLFLILGASISAWSAEESEFTTVGIYACSEREKWTFSRKIPDSARQAYFRYLQGDRSLTQSFGDALSLRSDAPDAISQRFSRYWLYKLYLDAGMFHLAATGFKGLILDRTNDSKKVAGIRLAALTCMNKIQEKYPTLYFEAKSVNNLLSLKKTLAKEPLARHFQKDFNKAALILTFRQFFKTKKAPNIKVTRQLIGKKDAYWDLFHGMSLIVDGDIKKGSAYLKRLLERKKVPHNLKVYRDAAQLTLARTYYRRGAYKRASHHFRKVSRDSNHVTRALIEDANAYLVRGDHQKAIGTALPLQMGGFRELFVPESYLVMAMSFNDLCQYPSAMLAIKLFQKRYRDSYRWLKKWGKSKKRYKRKYYSLILAGLKEKSSIPEKVRTDWMRSEAFVALQSEINLLLEEREMLRTLRRLMTDEISSLDDSVKEGLERSKLRNARAYISKVSKIRRIRIEAYTRNLIFKINDHIDARNTRMHSRLIELVKLAKLIKAEIYGQASEDVVWRSAHPEYEGFVENLKREKEAEVEAGADFNWGPATWHQENPGEIWEDELGSIGANATNICAGKNSYMKTSYPKNLLEKRDR